MAPADPAPGPLFPPDPLSGPPPHDAGPGGPAPVGPGLGEDAPAPRAGRTSAAALWGWVKVLAAAVAFALALRVLVFEAYRIPSTSMEDTLLVGDFVLVSKLHYGPRVLGRRLPGLGAPARGDVIVFNYPPDLAPDVARRTPYIKRVVGLPGDTLAIRAKAVFAGAAAVPEPRRGRRLWEVRGALPDRALLDSLGVGGRVQRVGPGRWVASATRAQAGALRDAGVVERVEPYVRPPGDGSATFPPTERFSLDDYGPVTVPRAGARVRLDDATWALLRPALERFEGRTAERTAAGFLIDGRPAEAVTFRQDYYFVLGDSRDDSADSRAWGFVPFDHVVGKAVGVYFSWDDGAGRPRWDRIGEGVE